MLLSLCPSLLVTVSPCVIGWFMSTVLFGRYLSTVHPLLLWYPSLLEQSDHYCWVGICLYFIVFVSINCW